MKHHIMAKDAWRESFLEKKKQMCAHYYDDFYKHAYCQPIIYILNTALCVDLWRNTDYIALSLVLLCPVHSQTCSTMTHTPIGHENTVSTTVQFVLLYIMRTETAQEVKHHLIRSMVVWECQQSEPQWKKPPYLLEPTWPYWMALREERSVNDEISDRYGKKYTVY